MIESRAVQVCRRFVSATRPAHRWPCHECGRPDATAPLRGVERRLEGGTIIRGGCLLCAELDRLWAEVDAVLLEADRVQEFEEMLDLVPAAVAEAPEAPPPQERARPWEYLVGALETSKMWRRGWRCECRTWPEARFVFLSWPGGVIVIGCKVCGTAPRHGGSAVGGAA